jgi:hypothetical protein
MLLSETGKATAAHPSASTHSHLGPRVRVPSPPNLPRAPSLLRPRVPSGVISAHPATLTYDRPPPATNHCHATPGPLLELSDRSCAGPVCQCRRCAAPKEHLLHAKADRAKGTALGPLTARLTYRAWSSTVAPTAVPAPHHRRLALVPRGPQHKLHKDTATALTSSAPQAIA